MTALIRNFYKAIMQRLKTHEFGLRATSRIKTFVFKFISVPAKWIKTSRRHVLNIYSDNNAYALFPLKEWYTGSCASSSPIHFLHRRRYSCIYSLLSDSLNIHIENSGCLGSEYAFSNFQLTALYSRPPKSRACSGQTTTQRPQEMHFFSLVL